MRRRRYLIAAAGAVGATTGLAGGLTDAGPCGGSGSVVPGTGSSLQRPPRGDLELPVSPSAFVRGARPGEIPAIVNPAFRSDWRGLDDSLEDDALVIGVARDGVKRAYPLSVLSTYEVVNDVIAGDGGDQPLVVSYCPLCASGVAAIRQVAGHPARFSVSGLLYRSDLVLYDHGTGSLWSQLLARALRGPATGERLRLVPSTMTTWRTWRRSHPDTEVLLPPPASGTLRPPAGALAEVAAEATDTLGNPGAGDRLAPNVFVVGVNTGRRARAYPFRTVRRAGVINDCVGRVPVVVADGTVPQVYLRVVDGETLWFESAGDGRLVAGGSEWLIATGEAVSGPHEGRVLPRAAPATSMFWHAWLAFHPDTTLYRR